MASPRTPNMAASWLHAPKTCPVYVTYSHISQSPFSSPRLCHCPLVSRLCVCLFVYSWTYVCPVRLCSLPHPGGLASVLHRRCSSLPQSHLAPLSKRPPPLQACIPTTSTTTTTTTSVTAPPPPSDSPQTRCIDTTQKKTNQLFLFSPSSPSFFLLPTQLIRSSLIRYFLPHFTLLIVSFTIILFYPVDSARSVSGVVMLLMNTRFPLLPGSLIWRRCIPAAPPSR